MKNKYICMLKINVNFLNMQSKVKLGQMFKVLFFLNESISQLSNIP